MNQTTLDIPTQDINTLEATLQQMVAAHEAMLTLLSRKRDALRQNDADALAQVAALEKEKVGRITELEKQRFTLVGRITLILDPKANAPFRLGELADRLPEPERGRLLVLRQQLRERMQQVRDSVSVVRRASETLMNHVQGLVQSVVMMANGQTTYSQAGHQPTQQTAIRTINITA
ncbi:flagellar protein FlgN [Phycisphaerales bacterium AB-hyl4]|uniref:Flagellar protein FlgN n=1 Tax=Natronomicrosphaera hydrolytica TaxID=3242702 RepID=A0ABV4U8Z1_9BACT